MRRFENRTAVVTGAARGIGFSIARRFLQEGARVALCDRDDDLLDKAAGELREYADRCCAVVADVVRGRDIETLAMRVHETLGPVGILINNAGISPKHQGLKAPVGEMSLAEWNQVLEVNLTGAFHCIQSFLPDMRTAGWGRIVNMASQAGRTRSDIAGAHYSASKAGLMALARTLAAEEGPHGITVNSVAPGRIDTPMADMAGAAINAEYRKRIPVGRLGTPEDVAAAVAFLASDEAGFITGVTLDVNGGGFMV